jgi:hypothetical protein
VTNIRFIQRNKLDEQQWNALISSSLHSLPYAYTWYLDSVAENWDALVAGNYEAVMPLVWLRKYGIKCLYQPYYCQQLGIFSKHILAGAQVQAFLNEATARFPYIHINLNPSAKSTNKASLVPKKNLLLNLSASYDIIKKKYSENHRRNISKATKAGIKLQGHTSLKDFQSFYVANINPEKEVFKPGHQKAFKAITHALISNQSGKIFSACDSQGNLLAAALIIFHQNRVINIINTSCTAGKKHGASHFLFDAIIQQLAGQNMLFDFEGSSVPSIARFYEGFGATEECFYLYKTSVVKKLIAVLPSFNR